MQLLASSRQLQASFLRWGLVMAASCLGLGFLSIHLVMAQSGSTWVAGLDTPYLYRSQTGLVIGQLSLCLFSAVSLTMLAFARGARGRAAALILAAAGLVLGLVWGPVLFVAHQLAVASGIAIACASALLLACGLAFTVRRVAGLAMLPCLAWAGFSGWLAVGLWQLNPAADGVVQAGVVARIVFPVAEPDATPPAQQ